MTSLGPFNVEYIKVNHSIIDGVGLAIENPEGIIINSGDFKIDYTPVDGYFTDLNRFAYYGKKDVKILFSDSKETTITSIHCLPLMIQKLCFISWPKPTAKRRGD